MNLDNIKVIAFDADDTLWVNEPYFRRAEQGFFELLKDVMPEATCNKIARFKKSLLILFLFITNLALSQNSYYVATDGNNSNSGTISSPWLTIQFGVNQLQAGDTLLIKGGVYEEKIEIDVSGTPNNLITIKSFESEEVVLDAINFSDDDSIIWTDNSYLQFEGLHVTNNIHNNAIGIMLQGNAHHINIINNKVSNIKFSSDPDAPVSTNTNAVPINIWADMPLDSIHSIVIRGNEVFHNQTGFSENIAASGNFSTFIIEDNLVHDNTNIGIDISGNYQTSSNPLYDQGRNGIIRNNIIYNCNSPYSAAAGIYIDGGKDIIVENNISHHNGYGGEIGAEENGSTSNVIFRNNIFYKNTSAGIHFGGYDENTTGIVVNSAIYNNTFYNNDTENEGNGELILTETENCIIENNIFYISSHNVFLQAYRTQTNLSFDYNLVYNLDGAENIETYGNYESVGLQEFYNNSGFGSNSIYGDPLFTNTETANFHIASNSIAIDSGNPLYIPATNEVDMDGEQRIFNFIIDCGADEYDPTAGVVDYSEKQLIMYPNPTSNYVFIQGIVGDENILVYNVLGSKIKEIKTESSHQKIDLKTLKKGIYFIVINSPNHTKKLFKIIKI